MIKKSLTQLTSLWQLGFTTLQLFVNSRWPCGISATTGFCCQSKDLFEFHIWKNVSKKQIVRDKQQQLKHIAGQPLNIQAKRRILHFHRKEIILTSFSEKGSSQKQSYLTLPNLKKHNDSSRLKNEYNLNYISQINGDLYFKQMLS